MTSERPDAIEVARRIWRARYADARVVLLAGSVVRGEATAYSDLDVLVVYERVEHAWRESFLAEGWPVEAFVHDPATLRWFFDEVDGRNGVPSLAWMAMEGVAVTPDDPLARTVKALAQAALDAGPPAWSEAERRMRRYVIADLVEDLRAPRSHAERVAAGARLYELVADTILRGSGRWSGRGKSIPRVLARHDAALAARFVAAFDALFAGDAADAIALCDDVLAPLGGMLFDGHRLDAPPSWRKG